MLCSLSKLQGTPLVPYFQLVEFLEPESNALQEFRLPVAEIRLIEFEISGFVSYDTYPLNGRSFIGGCHASAISLRNVHVCSVNYCCVFGLQFLGKI